MLRGDRMSRASLEQLADKLLRIEEEVRAIRGDLEEELRRETWKGPRRVSAAPRAPFRRVGGRALSKWAADLARTFSLEDRPVGALEVQEMSRAAGLEPDELSRGLIEAREE